VAAWLFKYPVKKSPPTLGPKDGDRVTAAAAETEGKNMSSFNEVSASFGMEVEELFVPTDVEDDDDDDPFFCDDDEWSEELLPNSDTDTDRPTFPPAAITAAKKVLSSSCGGTGAERDRCSMPTDLLESSASANRKAVAICARSLFFSVQKICLQLIPKTGHVHPPRPMLQETTLITQIIFLRNFPSNFMNFEPIFCSLRFIYFYHLFQE